MGNLASTAIITGMNQDQPDLTRDPPTGWLAALAESEAELAAGKTVPSQSVHRDLQDALTRIGTRRDGRTATR